MSYYTYLISSLPSLQFGVRPPFSFEKFMEIAQRFIPTPDAEILKNLSVSGEYNYNIFQPTLKRWQDLDTALRNELVKIRASRRHIDLTKYLRQDGYTESYISHLAMNAQRSLSILEAEKMLDGERWRALEEFSLGHYFDLDALLIYGLRLLILERWERVNSADKIQLIEKTVVVGAHS